MKLAARTYFVPDFPDATMVGVEEGIKNMEELKKLYQKAREVPSGLAMKLAEQAESKEERDFYAYIMTMNLQRKQKEAIEKNLF